MKINNKFEIGQEVYQVSDTDQCPNIIVGIYISPNGLTYVLSDGEEYYDIQISADKRVF